MLSQFRRSVGRPTIGRTMVGIASLAVVLGLARSYLPAAWVVGGWLGGWWLATLGLVRLGQPPSRLFWWLGLALHSGLITLMAYWPITVDPWPWVALILIATPGHLRAGWTWALAEPQQRQRLVSLVLASLLAAGVTIATDWPFRVAFAWARPRLDAIADRVQAGGLAPQGEGAGIFWIRDSVMLHHGLIMLTLGDSATTNGLAAFVRRPGPESLDPRFAATDPDDRWHWFALPRRRR